MPQATVSVIVRTTLAGARRPIHAPIKPPATAPTRSVTASGQYTERAAIKIPTATVLALPTSNVRGAFISLKSRSLSRPQAAIIMMPTAPPK